MHQLRRIGFGISCDHTLAAGGSLRSARPARTRTLLGDGQPLQRGADAVGRKQPVQGING